MKGLVGCWVFTLAFLLTGTEQLETQPTADASQGSDCSQIKALSPGASSGVYSVQPAGVNAPFEVFCEMRPDGGWTVFQRRSGGAVSFQKNWAAYKHGFGNLTTDHWLGLKKVFSLTKNKSKKWVMRVDLWDHEGATAFAQYKKFRLGNETTAFNLNVGNYSGDAGDAIRGAYRDIDQDQNGSGFSTVDSDNDGCDPCIFGDIAVRDCASSNGGGWWYSRCGSASLNSDWHRADDNIAWASGIYWSTWKTGAPYSLKATRMMIKSV
ncbi:angiopoietin-related protein 5-like [Brachionichthys hirsutus]|uniref:angiopoietin-related protein 5-like n=1 Tax=Brachionichthys hirsutus TaxID=412623 RepID=UPI003604F551